MACSNVDALDAVCSNELALGEGSSDERVVLGKLACSKPVQELVHSKELVLARSKVPEPELVHSKELGLALVHSMELVPELARSKVLELALVHSKVREPEQEHSKVLVLVPELVHSKAQVQVHSKVPELGKLACSIESALGGSNARALGGSTGDHAS